LVEQPWSINPKIDYSKISLDSIPYEVLRALSSGQGFYLTLKMPITWVLKQRLKRFANGILEQDKMLKNECLVHYLTQRELDWACYRRGFFPHKMLNFADDSFGISIQRQEQEKFLFDWVTRTSKTPENEQPIEILFRVMTTKTPNYNTNLYDRTFA
jgi:hypothetical protein